MGTTASASAVALPLQTPMHCAGGRNTGSSLRAAAGVVDSAEWGIVGRVQSNITRITADPAVCSGQTCMRGLRISAALVLK